MDTFRSAATSSTGGSTTPLIKSTNFAFMSRHLRARYYLGRLAMLEDDSDIAAARFERAVALDQSASDHRLWYGNALSRQAGHASPLKHVFYAGRGKGECERAVELDGRGIEAREALVHHFGITVTYFLWSC